MDQLSTAPPQIVRGGGQTGLYIVIFLLLSITMAIGVLYFRTQGANLLSEEKLKNLKAKLEKIQSERESDEAELEAKVRTREEKIQRLQELQLKQEAQQAAVTAELKDQLRLRESKIDKLQTKVKYELEAAAKSVKEANALKEKAQDAVKDANERLKEAEAAREKAEASGKEKDKKMAEEMKRVADRAAVEVAAAKKRAAVESEKARSEAKKALLLKTSLDKANSKLVTFQRNVNSARQVSSRAVFKAGGQLSRGKVYPKRRVSPAAQYKKRMMNRIRKAKRATALKAKRAAALKAKRAAERVKAAAARKKIRRDKAREMARRLREARKAASEAARRARAAAKKKKKFGFSKFKFKKSTKSRKSKKNFGFSKFKFKKSKSKKPKKRKGPSLFKTAANAYFSYHDFTDPSLKATRSDRRLKTDIVKIGELGGFNVYSWTWNFAAKMLYGLTGKEVGVLAQDLPADVVDKDEHGYLFIKPDTWVVELQNNIKKNF